MIIFKVDTHLLKISKNYITSDEPVGKLLKTSDNHIHRYSAGHKIHEWTSWSTQDTIFKQIKQVLVEEAAIKEAGKNGGSTDAKNGGSTDAKNGGSTDAKNGGSSDADVKNGGSDPKSKDEL